MATIAHNNHFVPQFYLRSWSEMSEKVWRYRLLVSHEEVPIWDQVSIVSTNKIFDLYTYDNGLVKSDEIEQWFNTEVETPAKYVIDKVVKDKILSNDDFDILSTYVAAQCVRTPARLLKQLEYYKNRLNKYIDSAFPEVIRKLETKIANNEKIEIERDDVKNRYIPMKVTTQKSVGEDSGWVKFEAVLGRGLWLNEIRHHVEVTSHVLRGHYWQIIRVSPGMSWCTSDDPVICLNYCGPDNYNFGGGWNRQNSEIILPLSPKYILYTKVGSSENADKMQENPFYTYIMQKLIIEHAHRSIYSLNKINNIIACRQRIVNSDTFNHEKESWDKLYAEHTLAENSLN